MSTITTSTPLTGTSTGTLNEAMRYATLKGAKRPEFVADYLSAVYELAPLVGLRPDAVVAQSAHETAAWTSDWFVNRGNVAGIGITGDPAQNAASGTWATGRDAAKAQLIHLAGYVRGSAPPVAELWIALDPRWNALMKSGLAGRARIVGDFGDGVWATDPDYAAKWVSRFADVFNVFSVPVEQPSAGGTPVDSTPLTFGLVPHPDYHDRPITKAEGVGQNNLGKRSVIGVTYHRMLGSLNGTDGYFRIPSTAALTDYGMGVAATDGASLDGVVYRWNNPLGYQSGWASGKVIAPWGDGLAFVNKYGANAVNKLRASIEISGNYDTPISDTVKQRIAEISAYWADQNQIPWNVYPIRPEDGFSFVCWHQEFTGPQEKVCPGAVVMNATDDIIARTAAILKQYQTKAVVIPPTPSPEKYAAPITYPWLTSDDGKVHTVGSTRVLPLTLTYTAQRATPRYQKGSKQSGKIGPNITKGTTFKANRVFRSGDGVTFVMSRYGTRILASALMPRVGVTESGRISIRHSATDDAPDVISDNVEESA